MQKKMLIVDAKVSLHRFSNSLHSEKVRFYTTKGEETPWPGNQKLKSCFTKPRLLPLKRAATLLLSF